MPMRKISVEEARKIAESKGLFPGKIKGTADGIQFTRGNNERIEKITWEEFEAILKKKKLAVYESNGWMKIMKA